MLKKEFELWLIKSGYKTKTPSGLPSTVPQYLNSIDKITEWECFSGWQQVAENIKRLVDDYDADGCKAELGKKSHNTVISALKSFKCFLISDYYLKKN